VPGRGEYWKVKAEAKRAASTTAMVASKSSSVSPGNPTMTSEVMAAPGRAERTRSRIPRKRSDLYERLMALRIRSEPDCRGMCRLGMTFGVSAIASTTASVKPAGWGEVNRTLSSPSMSPEALSRAEKASRSPNPTP
jgi:hypothetical protein